jgi:hypothetical protein
VRFLSLYKSIETNSPPSPEFVANMEKLIADGMSAGWLIGTEGCLPSATGARVRRDNGKITVKDGPFTESKEVVGGFAILEAPSKEEAIRLARVFLEVAGDGECELRQIFTADDPSSACAGDTHSQLVEQFAKTQA